MQKLEQIYKQLNDEQRKAVDTIEGPLLVLAGPGTGKTQLLSARVANILSKTDTPPQNILCLTFTDAAALNMRERLGGMIGEAAYDVHITTYHSFASDIIRSYPEFFETIDLKTGQDSRMERPIDELRQLEIVQSIIEKLPFSDPLRSARYYIKSVVSTIADFKQAAMSPEDVSAIASANLQAVKVLSGPINELMSAHARIPSKVTLAIELFENISNHLSSKKNDLTTTACLQLEHALASAREINKTKPLTEWKNIWMTKDENDTWSFTNPLHAEKLASLAKVFAAYQDALSSTGQYDFNDMIICTIEALKTKPTLKFNLQEKYQYILLDEFQDTNAAQFELVKQLADHPVHEGRPNIMAVGDDDQGIFAFQGADIGNMLSFKKSFRDVEVINLVKNYRSHKDILHVAHAVAEQIESRLHHSLKSISKDLVATAANLPANANVARHEFSSQASELGWIAERINKLLKDGVAPEEVAVLAPKHSILEGLVPFLNARGIPVAYEKRENIFDAPIVQSILLISEFLEAAGAQNTSQMDALLPKVLSLDFWGIATKEIWQLNWEYYSAKFENLQPWAKLAIERESTAAPTEFLLHLGSRADTLPLEQMLDYITGAKQLQLDNGSNYTSPLKQYYFSESAQANSPLAFYEAISHLSVIRSHLRDKQVLTEAQLTIHHLLQLYRTYLEAEQPLINTHPIAQSDHSVQLLTVYKAKGLEFEYVFLPSMQDDVWGSTASSAGNKLSLPPNLQHIRHDASTEDTRRRILFVAVTRARHGLVATSYAKKDTGKKTLPVKYFLETVNENIRVSGVLPTGSNIVHYTERTSEQAREDVDTLWHARHILLDPSLKSLLHERLQYYRMSPTHLNSFTNVEYNGPQAFLLNTILRFPEAPSPDSIYGDALHRTLEWFQKQGANGEWHPQEKIIDYYSRAIARTQLSDTDKAMYSARGEHALQKYLTVSIDWLKTPAYAEVDFRKEGVVNGKAVLTGKIDRLEVDEKNKTVRIIDFKSGSPSTKWSSQSKYIGYKQQLYFYHLLIEKSHSYAGYKVESAGLSFIEPLPSGEAAAPLTLQFNDDEYEDFKRLISIVWEKIQELDLPDISSYPSTAVGMRAFISYLLQKK